MTLDEIRKLVANERAVAEKATPGPLEVVDDGERPLEIMTTVGPLSQRMFALASCGGLRCEADAEAFARSRTAVPALCDAVDALLAVVEALPKCTWFGKTQCSSPATKRSDQRGTVYCDAHVPASYEASGGQWVSWHDNCYAATLRSLKVRQ